MGDPVPSTLSFGSYNLDTPAAAWIARLATPLSIVAVLGLAAWTLRLPPAPSEGERVDRLALAALGALLCAWLCAKVLSPQYLTWAIPLVVALGPTQRPRVGATLLVVMALTQAYLRGFYDHVTDMRPLGVTALCLRLAALLALAAFVARGLRAAPRVRPLA
jgi:hypothetical protein